MTHGESSEDRVFLVMICETLFAQRLGELLDELEVPGYTRFGGVSGVGVTGRHEGTAIWPGTNTIIFVALPDETAAAEVIAGAEQIIAEEYHKRPGFAAFKLQGSQLA